MDTEVTWWMQLIIGAAGTFGTVLLAQLGRLLNKLFNYFAHKSNLAFLANVDEYIMGVVTEVYNAEVKHAKKASADGKWTKEEKARFASIPLEKAKQHFSVKKLTQLAGAGVNEFLASRVEKAVTIAKNTGKAARATANP